MTARQLVLLSSIFLLAAMSVLYFEARPFFIDSANRAARFQSVADGENRAGLSTFSQRLALNNCFEAMNSIYGRVQPTPRRQAVLGECQNLADTIAAMSPANAFAWFVGALASGNLDDVTGMNTRLVQSQRTGANEQWIGELRVGLAERFFADLDAVSAAGHEQDLQMLVQSSRGVRFIARRYVSQPDFRARIAALVEELPEDVQARFVTNVRRAAADLGA